MGTVTAKKTSIWILTFWFQFSHPPPLTAPKDDVFLMKLDCIQIQSSVIPYLPEMYQYKKIWVFVWWEEWCQKLSSHQNHHGNIKCWDPYLYPKQFYKKFWNMVQLRIQKINENFLLHPISKTNDKICDKLI